MEVVLRGFIEGTGSPQLKPNLQVPKRGETPVVPQRQKMGHVWSSRKWVHDLHEFSTWQLPGRSFEGPRFSRA